MTLSIHDGEQVTATWPSFNTGLFDEAAATLFSLPFFITFFLVSFLKKVTKLNVLLVASRLRLQSISDPKGKLLFFSLFFFDISCICLFVAFLFVKIEHLNKLSFNSVDLPVLSYEPDFVEMNCPLICECIGCIFCLFCVCVVLCVILTLPHFSRMSVVCLTAVWCAFLQLLIATIMLAVCFLKL